MKPNPTQKQGNVARPVPVPGGVRWDESGDGASLWPEKVISPLPDKAIPLPKYSPPKK
ncbi:MAG: hypothetical protein NTZ04_01130 [Chloroflexi bacterium]|nr:hypothetical protein [Chloroflexota bacterium]